MLSLLLSIFQLEQQGQDPVSFECFVPNLNKTPLALVATSQGMTRQKSPHLPAEPFAGLGIAREADLAPSLPRCGPHLPFSPWWPHCTIPTGKCRAAPLLSVAHCGQELGSPTLLSST